MAFKFRERQWYLALVRKSFAGIPQGTSVYFAPYPSHIMLNHWVVFDGLETVYVMHIDAMKAKVESSKDDRGLPVEVDPETNKTLFDTVHALGFTTWQR